MKQILMGSTACILAFGLQAAMPAMAQTATAKGQIEEVTITAQKRKESLSKVAVTADVVNANALAQLSVTDITDLNKVVPAVSLNASTNGRTPYAMRGVSTTANEGNVGLESGVGIEIDGIPVPSDSHAAQQVVDVDNVQVLEGPQATLGGRTAAAGLIDMITRSPKDTFQGQVDGTFTSDGEKRGSFFVTGPLAPGLDVSLSGYGEQTPYPIKNLVNGERTTQGSTGFRAKLQYKPDALLSVTLAGHAAESFSYGDNFVYTYITPGSTIGPSAGVGAANGLPGVTVSNHNINTATIAQNVGSRIFDRDISLNASYQLGNLNFGSISAYQSESERDVQDLFNVDSYFWTDLVNIAHIPAAGFDNNQTIRNHVHEVSQEFKVASPSDDQFNYVAGLFASDTWISSGQTRFLAPAYVDEVASPETVTYDAYARATYKFTPQFSLTGGLRFNDDQLRYNINQVYNGNKLDNGFGPAYSSGHTNEGVVVGDINAQYQVTDRDMVYATYARGYAPGAYNTATALANNDTLSPIKRMDVNHFEIGTKGRYLDGLLVLNGDVFYTIYDNYQIETYEALPGFINPPLVLANAPQAQTHGVEVQGTWRPTVNTTIGVNAAYIDATFVNYKDAECWYSLGSNTGIVPAPTSGPACYFKDVNGSYVGYENVSGKALPNSPKFKFVINAEQRVPLDSLNSDLVLDAVYTWRSSAQMLPDQAPMAVQGSFGLLNLSAGLATNNGKYQVTAFVNNVTNKVYYTDVEDFFNSVWAASGKGNETVMGQPARDAQRYEGVRFSVKF